MSSTQLEFGIRTSTRVKNVHLVGSWDNYQRQLPLKTDSSRQDGAWRGVFKFQGSCIVPGSRYWYYYVLDGYQVVHDPSKLATVEPTTGRTLNILDVPALSTCPTPPVARQPRVSAAAEQQPRLSIDVRIARGRALSPSKIVSPKPVKPHESKRIINGDFSSDADWIERFDRMNMASRASSRSTGASIADSDLPSLTLSRSSNSSSPTSISSGSSGECTCQRYGVTRSGQRVKLDCGGALCGSGDDLSSCSDDDIESRTLPYNYPRPQPPSQASSQRTKLTINTNNSVSVKTIVSPLDMTPMRLMAEPMLPSSKPPMSYGMIPPQGHHIGLHGSRGY